MVLAIMEQGAQYLLNILILLFGEVCPGMVVGCVTGSYV